MKVAELLGVMALRFVAPIFVVSAIAKWWDLRSFRRQLDKARGVPWESPGGAGD